MTRLLTNEVLLKQVTLLLQCIVQNRREPEMPEVCQQGTILSQPQIIDSLPRNQIFLPNIPNMILPSRQNILSNRGIILTNRPNALPRKGIIQNRQNIIKNRQFSARNRPSILQARDNSLNKRILKTPSSPRLQLPVIIEKRRSLRNQNKLTVPEPEVYKSEEAQSRIANSAPSTVDYKDDLPVTPPNVLTLGKPVTTNLSPDAEKIVRHIKKNYDLIPKDRTNYVEKGGRILIPIKDGENGSSVISINIPDNFTGKGPYSLNIEGYGSATINSDGSPAIIYDTPDQLPIHVPERYPILPRHTKIEINEQNTLLARHHPHQIYRDQNPQYQNQQGQQVHKKQHHPDRHQQDQNHEDPYRQEHHNKDHPQNHLENPQIYQLNQKQHQQHKIYLKQQSNLRQDVESIVDRAALKQRNAQAEAIPYKQGNFQRIGSAESKEWEEINNRNDWALPEAGFIMPETKVTIGFEDRSRLFAKSPSRRPPAIKEEPKSKELLERIYIKRHKPKASTITFEYENGLRQGARRRTEPRERCTDPITFFKQRECQGTCAEAELSSRKGFRQNFCFCNPGQFGPNCAQRIIHSGTGIQRQEIWIERVRDVAVGVRPNLIAVYKATSLEDCQAICLGINRFKDDIVDSCGTVVYHSDEISYIGICEILAIKPIGACYSFRVSSPGHTMAILQAQQYSNARGGCT